MNAQLLTKMADSVVEAVRVYVDQREALLLKRIDELEKREPIPGPPGKDAPTVDVDALAAITLEKVTALIPAPIPGKDGAPGKDGVDGKDGANAAPVDIGALVKTVLAEIPVPQDGAPGKDGAAGKDADPVDTKAIAAEVLALVPVPENGKDGANGKDGRDADPVDVESVIKAVVAQIPTPKDGEPGPAGRDAPEVNTKALVDEVLKLVPVPKDGRDGKDAPPVDEKLIVKAVLEQVPPPIPGRDGMPGADGASGNNGKDGADGFGLDDFSVEKVDERTIRLKLESGERHLQKDIRFDVPLYRGVYMRGALYEKSDMVTSHNEVWIALVDKPAEAPGGLSKQWKLAVRKGRDSKPVKLD
jgi:hypothetical protein